MYFSDEYEKRKKFNFIFFFSTGRFKTIIALTFESFKRGGSKISENLNGGWHLKGSHKNVSFVSLYMNPLPPPSNC